MEKSYLNMGIVSVNFDNISFWYSKHNNVQKFITIAFDTQCKLLFTERKETILQFMVVNGNYRENNIMSRFMALVMQFPIHCLKLVVSYTTLIYKFSLQGVSGATI